MKLRWFVAALVAAVIGFGCSPNSAPSPSGLETSDLETSGLETLRAALGERDELERKYLLTSYLRTLRPEDVQPVLAEVEKQRAGIDADEVRLLMLAWTRFDGPGAFATAREWPSAWRSILMKATLQAWGYNDGRAALAELQQIEDEELRKSLEIELLSGWVKSHDRLGASEFAATVSEGRRRNRLALRLAGEAMRDGPDAVIAWADAVPADAPNDFKEAVFGNAAGIIARYAPKLVTAWYERHMQHRYTRSGLRGIAAKWAQYHDPGTLIAWIETLPIEETREHERVEAVRAAFRIWAAAAPAAAEAWLESASVGPTRDGAIDEFAKVIADASSVDALRWAEQIADEDLRRKRMLRFSRRWFAEDPAAAEAWLAEANVSPEWRQQILNNLPQAKPHSKRRDRAKNAELDG